MRKKLVLVAVGAALAAGAVVAARKCASMCSSETERPDMGDRMRACMDKMPENFPPRVMFDNAQAARENTERILEILSRGDVAHEAELATESPV